MSRRPCDRCEELLQDFLDRTLTNEEWREAEDAPRGLRLLPAALPLRGDPPPIREDDAAERMPPGLMAKLEELRGLDATA